MTIARRRGMPAVLPHTDPMQGGSIGLAQAEQADATEIARLARWYDAPTVLQGRMTLRDDGLWDTSWTLQAKAASGVWRTDVTTFDRAIAAGVEGSALRLAGIE